MPDWFWVAVTFVYGAVVGSFLNVCIWRLPRDESVVHPPSHCPHCGKSLSPADLVPLASQVLLGARPLWRAIPGLGVAVPIPLSIVGLLLGAGALWIIARVASAAFRREAMGMGDVFLLAAMGANLTLSQLAVAFFVAVAVGSLI